jgi:hypothetical protein
MASSSNDDVMPERIRLRWSCLLSRISERFDILNYHVQIMSLTGRLAPTGVPRLAGPPTLEQQMCPHLPANISLGGNQHASWGKCLKCTQRIFYLTKDPGGTDEFYLHQLNRQVLLEKLGVITVVGPEPVAAQAVGPKSVTSASVDGSQLLRRRSAPSSEETGQAESQRPSGPRSGVALVDLRSWCRACLRAFMPRCSSHP